MLGVLSKAYGSAELQKRMYDLRPTFQSDLIASIHAAFERIAQAGRKPSRETRYGGARISTVKP
jgi:hypothetical protein